MINGIRARSLLVRIEEQRGLIMPGIMVIKLLVMPQFGAESGIALAALE
jgi:hypothetical protein